MPNKDLEKRKEYHREYARKRYSESENREKRKRLKKEWDDNNREHINIYHRERYHSEPLLAQRHETVREKQSKANTLKQESGCSLCGENHIACLDFHHINPSDKVRGISQMITSSYSWDTILKEIEKCVVLCSNCHRKLHYEIDNKL